MSRFPSALFVPVLLCAVSFANVQHHKKQEKPSPAVASQPQVAPTPAAQQASQPATPENEPASPPDVNFQNGKLTIVARNSTMGDVLNAVRQKTGAAVDMPPTSGERVVGQFGPGAPRDVMAQLLNGSHYDYVLLGSPADPGALKKIVLMAKASGPPPAPPSPVNQQPTENLQQVPDVANDSTVEENNGEATPNGQMQDQEQVEQPEQSEQPDQSDQEQQQTPVVKTPEQLLRELQQQQQQQQQQQPDPSAPPGAPGQPPQ